MRTLLALVILVGAVGCEEPPAPTPPPPRPTATVPPLSDLDLPVPADFEEEAAKDVSDDNYKTILDGIEKELAR